MKKRLNNVGIKELSKKLGWLSSDAEKTCQQADTLSECIIYGVRYSMKNILLGLDMLIACSITIIVLLQRGDSGGALGIGGGGGGLFSARGRANFLTRTTAILAAMFFTVSLSLAYVSKKEQPTSIIDTIEKNQSTEQKEKPETPEDTPLAQ